MAQHVHEYVRVLCFSFCAYNILLCITKYFVETNTVTPVIHTPEAEHESSTSSSRSPVESPASPVIDADLARMEVLLDNWCLDLKRNVLVRNGLCCTM